MIVQSRGVEDTIAAGRALGERLRPGQSVCLFGDLGAGKTAFTKGIATALGIPEREITSASFTIVAEHFPSGGKTAPLYHIDLYRLAPGADLEELGLYEYMGGSGIAVIEWADRLPKEDIEGAVRVDISFVNQDTREIIIEGAD